MITATVPTSELRDALSRAGAVLRAARGRASSMAFADDPLRLDLPPLLDGSSSPSAATLRLAGALYLQAELDQAGIVIAAELLVYARDGLAIHDTLAKKLEDYAQAMRSAGTSEWIDAARRAQLYARMFGVGAGAGAADGVTRTNRAFEQMLAALCAAILRVEAAFRWSSTPDAMLDASVRFAARALLLNLGAQQYGVSSITASRLDRQLRASIGILGDEELGGMLGLHGVWAVAKALLGANAPDAGRHAARGAAGQTLLHWLATVLPAIADERSQVIVTTRDSGVFGAAARWFVASGLSLPRGQVQ
jgi:hypothetical protein